MGTEKPQMIYSLVKRKKIASQIKNSNPNHQIIPHHPYRIVICTEGSKTIEGVDSATVNLIKTYSYTMFNICRNFTTKLIAITNAFNIYFQHPSKWQVRGYFKQIKVNKSNNLIMGKFQLTKREETALTRLKNQSHSSYT